MERKLVGPHLRLVDSRPAKTAPRSSVSKAAAKAKLDSAEQLLPFPSGSLTYGSREAAFRAIGLDKGSPWAVDTMADALRAGFPDTKTPRKTDRRSGQERGWQEVRI